MQMEKTCEEGQFCNWYGRRSMIKSSEILAEPFALPNGSFIKNRIVKSAMSEALGTVDNRPTGHLARLYARFADGGVGLSISGNVMIDRRALGEPHNVVVEDEKNLQILKDWAAAGTQNGTKLWMQINHPGKQAPKWLNRETVAPSAIPFRADMTGFFSTPRALSESEIEDVIQRFGRTALIAKKAGFSGVQIHGAHGYLVSQFLSPHHNQRTDRFGGNADNRRRFMLAILAEMRQQVGALFPIGIKLNSADFQRGGFSNEESLDALRALEQAGIDMIEISGGTYEAPAMMGSNPARESTRQREAYFLEFALEARRVIKVPLLVTGGFRTLDGMADAIRIGAVDLIGLARPLVVEPDLPSRLVQGLGPRYQLSARETGIKFLDRLGFQEIAWYARQLRRMGYGYEPRPYESPLLAFLANAISGSFRFWRSRQLGV